MNAPESAIDTQSWSYPLHNYGGATDSSAEGLTSPSDSPHNAADTKMGGSAPAYRFEKNKIESRSGFDFTASDSTHGFFFEKTAPVFDQQKTLPDRSSSGQADGNGDKRGSSASPTVTAALMPNPSFFSRVEDSPITGFDPLLLELVLPMAVRSHNVEEGQKLLGISIRCGKASNGVSRQILLRLTDPSDPFFLYEMELREEDYGLFKQRLELVVDFNGFPRFLSDMLHGIDNSTLPYVITFLTQGQESSRGILRIVENTPFRTMEQLSLCLVRQGDAGQKKHLAERFQYFESAFKKGTATWKSERDQLINSLEGTRRKLDDLKENYQSLQERQRSSEACSEKKHSRTISDIRIQHDLEMKLEAEKHSAATKVLQDEFHRSQQELLANLRQKDDLLQHLQDRCSELDTQHVQLDGKHRLIQASASALESEIQSLRQANIELKKSQDESLESLRSKDLAHATLSERLNGLTAALAAKSLEFNSLKQQHDQQNTLVSSLTSQNKQLSENIKNLEKNIEKAHYIIGTQLNSLKTLKDRYRIATEQMQTQEQLLSERQATLTRVKEELENTKEKIHRIEQRDSKLEAELEKSSSTQESLSLELQTLREALIKIQKSSSTSGHYFPHRLVYPTTSSGMTPFSSTSNLSARAEIARFRSPFHQPGGGEELKKEYPSQAGFSPSAKSQTPNERLTASFGQSAITSYSSDPVHLTQPISVTSTSNSLRPSNLSSPEWDSRISHFPAAVRSDDVIPSSGELPLNNASTPTPNHVSDSSLYASDGKRYPTPTSSSSAQKAPLEKLGNKGFTSKHAKGSFLGSEGPLALPKSAYFA